MCYLLILTTVPTVVSYTQVCFHIHKYHPKHPRSSDLFLYLWILGLTQVSMAADTKCHELVAYRPHLPSYSPASPKSRVGGSRDQNPQTTGQRSFCPWPCLASRGTCMPPLWLHVPPPSASRVTSPLPSIQSSSQFLFRW